MVRKTLFTLHHINYSQKFYLRLFIYLNGASELHSWINTDGKTKWNHLFNTINETIPNALITRYIIVNCIINRIELLVLVEFEYAKKDE